MDENFMLNFSENSQIELIKNTNSFTNRFGLCLTDSDVHELMIKRKECLSTHKRVEFGKGILEKLIFAFCDSSFIYQDIYVETITRLQNIFYSYKNESMDILSDDELITIMKDAFEGICQGSLDYLEGTYLERFSRSVRANKHNLIKISQDLINPFYLSSIYTIDELLPIIAELAEKYTSKESSSLSYESARQLMLAILYCIAHFENKNTSLPAFKLPSAKEAYELGYNAVIEKVEQTRKKYNELMQFFDHYGNKNYQSTIEKAIPGFFLHYDAKFLPMDNIITMDYPIFNLNMKLEVIDMIKQYIDAIFEEQLYLKQFPRKKIINQLRSFHQKYENEYFNLKEIVELQLQIE